MCSSNSICKLQLSDICVTCMWRKTSIKQHEISLLIVQLSAHQLNYLQPLFTGTVLDMIQSNMNLFRNMHQILKQGTICLKTRMSFNLLSSCMTAYSQKI